MRWEVLGTGRDTGTVSSVIVEAATEEEARAWAGDAGIDPSAVEPVIDFDADRQPDACYYRCGDVAVTGRGVFSRSIAVPLRSITAVRLSRRAADWMPATLGVALWIGAAVAGLVWFNDRPGDVPVVPLVVCILLALLGVVAFRSFDPRPTFRVTLSVPGTDGYALTFNNRRVASAVSGVVSSLLAIGDPSPLSGLPRHSVSLAPIERSSSGWFFIWG